MFIDEILQKHASYGSFHTIKPVNHKEISFLISVHSYLERTGSVTTKQAFVARKILSSLNGLTEQERQAIESNSWRNPPRESDHKRPEARYIGDNVLVLSFSSLGWQNDYQMELSSLRPVKRNGLHLIRVNRNKQSQVVDFINRYNFQIDEETLDFLNELISEDVETILSGDDEIIASIQHDDLLANFILSHLDGEVL